MVVAFYFTLLENKHRYLFADIIFNKRKHYKFGTRHFSCKLWTVNGPVDTTWYECSFYPLNQETIKARWQNFWSRRTSFAMRYHIIHSESFETPIKSMSRDTTFFHLHQVIYYSVNQLLLWIPVALSCTLLLYFHCITVAKTFSIIFPSGDCSLSKLL